MTGVSMTNNACSLLGKTAVCPVAVSEPLNYSVRVFQGHDHPSLEKMVPGTVSRKGVHVKSKVICTCQGKEQNSLGTSCDWH